MDWTAIITGILTFIAGGGLVAIFTLPAIRKKANAEADNAVIEPLKQAINILNEQLKNANATIEEKNSIIEQKTQHELVLSNKLTALFDDMCVHKGCKLRKPHQGQGQRWYEDHKDDPSLGCDYLSIEWLLKQWRARNAASEDEHDKSAKQ